MSKNIKMTIYLYKTIVFSSIRGYKVSKLNVHFKCSQINAIFVLFTQQQIKLCGIENKKSDSNQFI